MAEQVNAKRMALMLSANGDHLYRWKVGPEGEQKNCWTYDEPPANHDGSEPPFPWIDDIAVLQMLKIKVIKKVNHDVYRYHQT